MKKNIFHYVFGQPRRVISLLGLLFLFLGDFSVLNVPNSIVLWTNTTFENVLYKLAILTFNACFYFTFSYFYDIFHLSDINCHQKKKKFSIEGHFKHKNQ